MSNNYKTILQSNNTELNSNNLDLQNLINKANALPDAAGGSEPVLQDKTVTPTTSQQTVTADSGYDGLDTVTVNAIPSTYVKPTTTKGATTYTPTTTNQTIASGTYLTGTQTIKGDSNLKASNIKSGVTIFGVTGTADVGGGDTPSNPTAIKNDVNFYDYDGTLLYSYTVEEAQALTELPPLPTHEGLTCQGWNYDLATIKSYNQAVDVGATYITDDGKTRLYIRIAAEGRMNVPLYFSQTVSNGVTIDWGDGSATQTLSGTGKKNTTHTYASIGDYVISLKVASGCTLSLGHNSSYYCVMGAIDDNGKVYCNMLQKVEIGSGVTNIDNIAFSYCYSLANIIIPNSVTRIGDSTFYNCRSLASIIIPNSVTSIDGYAFSNCSSLASIVIPNSVTSIGNSAFYYCYSLANIIIPNSVTRIGNDAFDYCCSLASIVISNGVASIGYNVFYYCSSLASIVIPNSVTSIGRNAFSNCYSLASIVIPNSVTSIGNDAFSGCSGVAIYDFTSHTSVPTLSNTDVFYGIQLDCIIKVPAALYDEWIVATNWANFASQIVAVSPDEV